MDQEPLKTIQPSTLPEKKEEEWKNVLSIVFLVAFPILGLILTWLLATWTKKTKSIITVVFIGIFVLIILIYTSLFIFFQKGITTASLSARDSKRLADISQIRAALESYYGDKGSFPVSDQPIVLEGQCLSSEGGISNVCSGVVYMSSIPSNPTPSNDGNCPVNDYIYSANSPTTYSIQFCLGSDVGGIKAGTHYLTPQGIN